MFDSLIYRLKRPFHFIKTGLFNGLPATIKYGFPSRKLTIIGITGTDGKTTSATMLYHVLNTAGIKTALLSTVAAYVGDQEIDTGFHVTSPQPSDLQSFFKKMVDANCTHVVLEITSHGMYQYRTWGVKPDLAGVTNITHEHLDYHQNYQNYVAAKAMMLASAQKAFINQDDQSHNLLSKLLAKKTTLKSYALEDEIPTQVRTAINLAFPEVYNRSNAVLVWNLAAELGITAEKFAEATATFPGIRGRMEEIPTKKQFDVIVDFAHTPHGLEQALTALQKRMRSKKNQGRVIAVYGSAGLRDYQKRPIMGKIGCEKADLVVFTAEDPRTEDVWSIIHQMKSEIVDAHHKIISIGDRREAISFALKTLAQPGDIIGIFGKGHEKSLCYGTVEYPWSDQKAVLEILEEMKS